MSAKRIPARAAGSYVVKYRLDGEERDRTDGDTFDLRRDAFDERNWFFGSSPGVTRCWIERNGKTIGAVLTREVGK